ncbi:MAG: DUF3307 domain-containing protein [Dethiobacteria bacterium]|jgi:hypothetical protein
MELLLSMILAHVIADFLLQSPRIAEEKCQGLPRGYLLHFAGHLITLALLTHPFFSPALVILWLILPAAHLLVDWLKNRLFSPTHPADALIFLLDQTLHLLLIFCTWQWTGPPLCEPVVSFYQRLLTPAGRFIVQYLFQDIAPGSLLLIATVYGYVIFGGAVLVRKVLDLEALRLTDSAGSSAGNTRQAGRYIGMLERALLLTFTLASAFTSIAFVLTAKSIARYKELEDRDFAEYYLAGTLLSTLLAILGGLLLKSLL